MGPLGRLALPALLLALLAGACSGEGNVFSLEAGDCFQRPTEDQVADVETVDCTEAHDNEVFYTEELEDGEFPGRDAVDEQAAEICEREFADYVGIDYLESELFIFPLSPTQESWDQGDREVVCSLYLPGEQLSESQEGAER